MHPSPTPSTQERESALFALALEKPLTERSAFLQIVCGKDNVLRQRLEALLVAHDQPDNLVPTQAEAVRPTIKLDLADAPDEAVGQTLGRYKLLERVGEGGCGVVYVAEQTEPVRRRVALKVIKLGMDTKQVVARFEAERQALAMMDHPNIAKVLDAGTTGASDQSTGASDQSTVTSDQSTVTSDQSTVTSDQSTVTSDQSTVTSDQSTVTSDQSTVTSDQSTEGGVRRTRRESPTTDHCSLMTGSGRPYFVMELVRGIRITDYCDQANLTTKERLDLFIKVCQAIQHAHQKGIIHRDIKPSNILVTLHDGVPVPKVTDFGIAKATEGRLSDNTVYTQLHQFIGTPAYMSPEQAEMSGLDIDTRSDIYSLGVLLYELLAGSTPFDAKELMASGIDAMRKTIREKEPVRPSTRLTQELTLGVPPSGGGASALATRRTVANAGPPEGGTPNRDAARIHQLKVLIATLKGDLDWIVMKCLEKDRTRRYETANGLAADLKRHLNNELVTARPPSAAYRFQKLLRRNKVMSVATALVLTAILVGTLISIGQTFRARRELRRALVAEANAQAALQFIQEDVLSQASPGYQPDRELTVRALLDRIAGRFDRATGRPPLVEASIRQTLGSVYTELGDYAKAIEHYETALRIQTEHLGKSHLDTLRSLYGLAMARWWSGNMAQAEPLARQGLEESRRALGEKNPLTIQFMQARAATLVYSGTAPWTELEPLFIKTLGLHREVLGSDNPATLRLIYGFGLGYLFNYQPAKAAPLVADALDRSGRALGERHPNTAALASLLASVFSQLNQLERAEALALRAVELRRDILGAEHYLTINSICLLARIRVQQRQFDKAEPLTDQVLDLSRRLQFENSPFLAWVLSNLGWEYLEQGQLAQADAVCNAALQSLRHKPDANPMAIPNIIINLGAVRIAQQKYAEAETLLREGSPLAEKYWPDAPYRYYAMNLLGASLAGQMNYTAAEPLLLQSCQGLQQRQASLPPCLNAPRRIAESLERLGQLYDDWGKPAQAAEWKQKLAAFQQAAKVSDHKSNTP